MTLDERFADAQTRVKALAKAPDTDTLLQLYALYKQGSSGDATGSRPGMMDFKGRAKWDAWAAKKGMTADAAKTAYAEIVDRLANA